MDRSLQRGGGVRSKFGVRTRLAKHVSLGKFYQRLDATLFLSNLQPLELWSCILLMAQTARHGVDTPPPDQLRSTFKKWQRSTAQEIANSPDILDLNRPDAFNQVTKVDAFTGLDANIESAVSSFMVREDLLQKHVSHKACDVPQAAYRVNALPGAHRNLNGLIASDKG